MVTYCPNCNKPHTAVLACPGCGGALLSSELARIHGIAGYWMQTAIGRVLIGLLLAQGLFHAVQRIATGILLGFLDGEQLNAFNASLGGVIFWQVLQCLALLVGAGVSGSGDTFGFFYGTLVGVSNGVVCGAFPLVPGTASGDLAVYGQPLIQAAVGLFGGWVGSVLWRPPPELSLADGRGLVRKSGRPRGKPWFAGPVHWFRVLIGATVAIVGVFWAGGIFDAMLEAGRGRLATGSYYQDQIFIWEIKVLVMLLGGGLAGANTMNGLKQGMIVGGATAFLVFVVPHARGTAINELLLVLVPFSLCSLGGWFGGQLLPPIVRRPKPRDLGPMS